MMITLDAVQLYDMGFGPLMVPVAPPGVQIAPGSTLKDKALGKAPGKLTLSGWVGVDLNDPKTRCPDYQTAKLWTDWGANIGLAAGEGLVIIDNDQGAVFSSLLHEAFQAVGIEPLRRYVQDPKHERDAWLFQVRDFIGEPVSLPNMNLSFRDGVATGDVQLLAKGKQLVVSGVHRGTKGPYVLDRPLTFDELPVLSEEGFQKFLIRFQENAARLGWTPVGAVSQPVSRPDTTIRNLIPSSKGLTQEQITSAISGAAALLVHLPNREVPLDQTTAADRWLDGDENWVSVAYALAAYLGAAADTPQARNLFLEWAMGRPQPGQDPDTLWTSALRQPLKYGGRGLLQIVQALGMLPPASFPDLDPNDPAFKVTPPGPRPLWDKLKSEWAYFTIGHGHFIHITAIERAPIDQRAFAFWRAPECKALMKELEYKPKKGERPTISTVICAQPDKVTVHSLTYAPGEDPILPGGVFNYWRPTTIKPQVVDPKQINFWLEHVRYVLGDVEGDDFIQWCAFVAQHPVKKPNWHFLIMTQQGVGKDLMMQPVKLAVGAGAACQHADMSTFHADFNEALQTKLLIISEVGKHHNDAVSAVANRRLKQVLATPPETITINAKYRHKLNIKNRLAVVMFANDSEPLMLEPGQRRIRVVNRLEINPKGARYYELLTKWLDDNDKANAKLVASYLMNLKLPDDKTFMGMAPGSDDKTELEKRNVPVGLQLLEEIIDEARQGLGSFSSLVSDAKTLVGAIKAQSVYTTSPQVSGWLKDMERGKKGVGRLRVDPKRPTECAVISDSKTNRSGRLWHLGEKSKDGRPWADFSHAELVAMWHDEPLPPRAKVLSFPKTVDGDEKV